MPAPRTNPSRPEPPAPATFAQSVRKRSDHEYLGVPLWAIAVGPDFEKGEIRGHARGVLAIGDVATGVIAIGGIARGVVALGGLAAGIVAIGGLAIGGLALGGAAIGLVAAGGAALGAVAMGGAAVGIYAAGSAAFGTHVVSPVERDPAAIAFFTQWEWLRDVLPRKLWR